MMICLSVASVALSGCAFPKQRELPEFWPLDANHRPWMDYGYKRKSPEAIVEKIRNAKYCDHILAGIDALGEIGSAYDGEDKYQRALEALREVHGLSQNEFAERPIIMSDNADASYSNDYDRQRWEQHKWLLGDVVAYKVYGAALSLRRYDPCPNELICKFPFHTDCIAFIDEIRPPDTKPELLRLYTNTRAPFDE